VAGDARFQLAWATVDNDLTVREVRAVASDVSNGASVEEALRDYDVTLGEITLRLPPEVYRELRREAAYEGVSADEIATDALNEYLD
jgi:hypothetical protein